MAGDPERLISYREALHVDRNLAARLRDCGITVPTAFVSAEWYHASDHDWFAARYSFAPPGVYAPASAWSRAAIPGNTGKTAIVEAVKKWAMAVTSLPESGMKIGIAAPAAHSAGIQSP